MKKTFTALLGIFILLNLFSCSSSDDPESSHNKLLAYNYATDFVKQSLKSPSTAVFPGADEKVEGVRHMGDYRYRIISWVESQNGFGGMVKSNFDCIIKIDKTNSTVSKESVSIY